MGKASRVSTWIIAYPEWILLIMVCGPRKRWWPPSGLPSGNKHRFVEAFLLSRFTYETFRGFLELHFFGSVFCPEFSTNMSNMLDELPSLKLT